MSVCVLLCECVVVLLRLLRITRICKYIFMREVANLSILQLFDLIHISNYLLHTHEDHFQKWRPCVHPHIKKNTQLMPIYKMHLFTQKQIQVKYKNTKIFEAYLKNK